LVNFLIGRSSPPSAAGTQDQRTESIIQTRRASLSWRFELKLADELGPTGARGYELLLPDMGKAVLRPVSNRGWSLLTRSAVGIVDDRGLFGCPEDAVALLHAEYNIPRVFTDTDAPVGSTAPFVEKD
jgi:hypothetical protein